MTRFRARRRRRARLLLITAVGIVAGSLLPRIQAGATVPTARAGQVLAGVASESRDPTPLNATDRLCRRDLLGGLIHENRAA
jgi:hypothetical protein